MTIEANPQRLQDARDWAHDCAAEAGLGEAECFQVRLAMSEAVTNAIEHGSHDPADEIRIEVFVRDGSLTFEVSDTGTFAAPLGHSNLDDEGGRGLEVLAIVMDEVHITAGGDGSVLRFAKRLEPEPL
jgi:anti-sigma regulatory factor (Ser/Thr protein kinase)